MIIKFRKFKSVFGYLAAVGISIFVLMFIITSSLIGYEVKNECLCAQQRYGGDCVEALTDQLNDTSNDFSTRNTTIWALGEIGDIRALTTLKSYYTGIIPAREPWDANLSQYEMQKAIRLIESGFNITAWIWRNTMDLDSASIDKSIEETVILSDPEDAYYALAQTIADSEDLLITENLPQALTYRPKAILWVASPDNLEEEDLWTIGRIFKDMDFYPALGIISGETYEIAEQLWQRGKLTKSGNNFLGTDVEIDQQIYEAIIVDLNHPDEQTISLTKDALIQTLEKSDYFYWVRHVGASKWMWATPASTDKDAGRLNSADIPELGPIVIQTPSCGSFQPWKEDSIAMGFINHGAAAYLGHVHTNVVSNSFLARKEFTVPGAATWSEFPLGILAQVRNKIETRVSSSTPLYFMLGDPRAYLSSQPPYRITTDEVVEDTRTVKGTSETAGYLAVKVENGARYDFTTVSGLTAASEDDFFFNNNLQTLNLGGDKYLLFYQQEQDFEIILKEKAPLMWIYWDGLIDALDYNWITIGVVFNPLSLVFLLILAILLRVKCRKGKKTPADYKWFFMAGILSAIPHMVYVMLRMHRFTVSASLIDYSTLQLLLGFIGLFSTTSAGLIMVKDAKKKAGKVIGWILAIFPQFLLTTFKFGIIAFTNILFINSNQVHKQLWNFNSFWLSFIVLVIEWLLAAVLFRAACQLASHQNRNRSS